MISEREGVIFSLCIMENFVNAFDREFDSMNEGVGLFAEAMAVSSSMVKFSSCIISWKLFT